MEATVKPPRGSRPRLRGRSSSARLARARARVPRYAFLAFVVVMCAAGMRSILAPAAPAPAPGRGGPPLDFAEQSFALGFARAYLTYDSAHPERREAALEPFLAAGLELGAGFVPPDSGAQRVRWVDVAQAQRPLSGGVAITVEAKLSDAREPVYLSVPVQRAKGGAIYLAGYPSFVGPPLHGSQGGGERGGEPVDDAALSALVKRALANYLAGDAEDLSADLASAATVTLPSVDLALRDVERLDWVHGTGGGAVLATVGAAGPRGGSYTLLYEVGVQRSGTTDPRLGPGWRVTYVQAISQQS